MSSGEERIRVAREMAQLRVESARTLLALKQQELQLRRAKFELKKEMDSHHLQFVQCKQGLQKKTDALSSS